MKKFKDNKGVPAAAQGKGFSTTSSGRPICIQESAGDCTCRPFSVEELRLLYESKTGVSFKPEKNSLSGGERDSPLRIDNGVVLTLSNNPDQETGSYFEVCQGFWSSESEPDPKCYEQQYQLGENREVVFSRCSGFSLGMHSYAACLGICAEGDIKVVFDIYELTSSNLVMYRTQIKCRPFILNNTPVAFFSYDPRWSQLHVVAHIIRAKNLCLGHFHHLQLAQID